MSRLYDRQQKLNRILEPARRLERSPRTPPTSTTDVPVPPLPDAPRQECMYCKVLGPRLCESCAAVVTAVELTRKRIEPLHGPDDALDLFMVVWKALREK